MNRGGAHDAWGTLPPSLVDASRDDVPPPTTCAVEILRPRGAVDPGACVPGWTRPG